MLITSSYWEMIHSHFYIDIATGSSMDWAYDVGKVPLAFGFELRDTRNGIAFFVIIVNVLTPTKKTFIL